MVANRTVSKIEPIQRSLEAAGTACEAVSLEAASLETWIPQVDLVINATSLGLTDTDRLPVETGYFRADQCVLDTIYQPSATAFLATARAAGARTANGLAMLLHQGARAFELWTGQAAPVEVMRAALREQVYGGEA